MLPTIFFLFFLIGFLALALGFLTRAAGIMAIGGMVLLILLWPLEVEGFTDERVADKNTTYTFTYYPMYTNQTVNMTETINTTQTYGYSTIQNELNTYLGVMLLFLGLTGVIGSVVFSKEGRQ